MLDHKRMKTYQRNMGIILHFAHRIIGTKLTVWNGLCGTYQMIRRASTGSVSTTNSGAPGVRWTATSSSPSASTTPCANWAWRCADRSRRRRTCAGAIGRRRGRCRRPAPSSTPTSFGSTRPLSCTCTSASRRASNWPRSAPCSTAISTAALPSRATATHRGPSESPASPSTRRFFQRIHFQLLLCSY